MKAQHFYDFGPFRLDAAERILLRDGHPLPLTPKDLDTLLVLVENRGHIVEKEELLKRVWPGTYVEEGNLARHVSNLRNLLGAGSGGQKFIETVPKRGYRFVAPVVETNGRGDLATVAVDARKSEVGGPTAAPAAHTRKYLFASLLLVVLAVALFLAYRFYWPAALPSQQKMMVAVMPVENMSGNAEYDYITDGLTEEIIAQLGSVQPEQMGVIARTSSMAYKGTRKRADEIARELGINYLVETSFRGTPEHMRITSQLIRVKDQTHLWTQSYDRDLRDIVTLEQEIAQAIAGAVELKLTPPDARRAAAAGPVNPEVYLLYLKGRQAWNTRTGEGLRQSLTYFRQAIEKEPTYARAHAGVADALNIMLFYGYVSGKEAIDEADRAARKAIQLNEALPEGHAALGYANFFWHMHWKEAEQEFLRAIAIDENYAPAHHWYALHLAAMGRREESIAEIQEALKLDPLSPIVNTAAGYVYYFARDYDRSVVQCRQVLKGNSNFPVAYTVMGMAYSAKGDVEQALKQFQTVVALRRETSASGFFHSQLAYAYAMRGDRREAQRILQELGEPEYGLASIALVHLALGKKDEALTFLERAYVRDDVALVWLKVDPVYDRLRGEPRFQALLQRLEFPK